MALLLAVAWSTVVGAAGEVAVHVPGAAAALPQSLQRQLAAAGADATVRAQPAPLAHWLALRSEAGADAALESAHFAAWRLRHRGWRLLAVGDTPAAWSLVARRGVTLVDADDLADLHVAMPPPPSLPALQVLALFPDPLHSPRLTGVAGHEQGVAMVRSGRADVAVVPEPVSRGLLDLHRILTLEAVPAAALSVSPDIDAALGEALLAIVTAADGPPALRALRLRPATAEAADDLVRRASLLTGSWGADP